MGALFRHLQHEQSELCKSTPGTKRCLTRQAEPGLPIMALRRMGRLCIVRVIEPYHHNKNSNPSRVFIDAISPGLSVDEQCICWGLLLDVVFESDGFGKQQQVLSVESRICL